MPQVNFARNTEQANYVHKIYNMNDVLKSFKKMRMHKKIKSPKYSSGCSSSSAAAAAYSSSSYRNNIHNNQDLIDHQTQELMKILKLLKKHVKKQISFNKKTKLLI